MKRKTDNFNKFFNRKRNSAVKEEIRQEKKLVKKERREAVEKHFEEKRKLKTAGAGVSRPATGAGLQKRDERTTTPDKQAAQVKGPGVHDKQPVRDKGSATHDKQPAHGKQPTPDKGPATNSDTIPLNKYIAHAGVSSRRASALLVKEGRVTVNGAVVTDPGTKVLYTDTVKVNGKKVTVSSHFVYILLNKPKDFLTTTTDPQGRKTVQQLISKATEERVYPIGRLDRNTSGVLLFTNDGDLAQKLSHPKNEMKKIYHAGLDKPLTKMHFEKILGGIELEDGIARVDEMAYADPKDKTQIGLEIHSGKNRIVRRIFESLGYDVKTLDRVMYAGLTKKNVQRGNWRFLTEKEIRALKYLKA
jgi:23S rRNA pseudouridine2605 synthase